MALAISHQLKIFVCILEVYKTADLQTTATLKATRYFQAPTNSCGSNISFEHVNILLESFPSASKYNHHILEEYNALNTSERNYIFHVKKDIGGNGSCGWLVTIATPIASIRFPVYPSQHFATPPLPSPLGETQPKGRVGRMVDPRFVNTLFKRNLHSTYKSFEILNQNI